MSQIDVGDRAYSTAATWWRSSRTSRHAGSWRGDPIPPTADGTLVSITGAGRRQLRRLDMILASIQDELLAPLSKAERRELTRLLQRVLDPYRPTDDASITPH